MIKPQATGFLFDVVMNLFSKENPEKESFKGNFCRTCSALIPALDLLTAPATPAKVGPQRGGHSGLGLRWRGEPLTWGAPHGVPGSLGVNVDRGRGPFFGSQGRCHLSWTTVMGPFSG